MSTEKTVFDEIRELCDQAGISISELCREAKVNRSSVEKWKQGDPQSIRIYRDLMETLTKLKQDQAQSSSASTKRVG